MKKLFLLAFTVCKVVFAMGQETPINHYNSLFSNKIKQQNHQNHLKAATGTTKMRLDSIVADYKSKSIFTYDVKGNCTRQVKYYWGSNAAWKIENKWEYAYDINGNNTCTIYYYQEHFSNMGLKPDSKTEYTYNENGNISLAVVYTWDSSAAIWKNNFKIGYTYDSNSNIMLELWYNDSYEISENLYKFEYAYNSNGNLIHMILSAGYENDNSTRWEGLQKWEYTYDDNNNYFFEVEYDWNNSQWNLYRKYEYTYDTSIRIDDLIMPNANIAIQYMVTTESDYSYINASWEINGKYIYYYSPQVVSTVVLPTSKSTLKAATKDGQLQVSGMEKGDILSVFNLQGKAIYCQKAVGNTTLINLPTNGLFIVHSGSQSIKVVK